jgi:hypothetical protein
MQFKKEKNLAFFQLISMPVIYGMIVPVVFLDICTELYHRICFPLYNLKYIKRSEYIRIDRHKIKYLNLWEKINCMYCGYANGVFQYVSAIGGRTEWYWCGIRHKRNKKFHEPIHQEDFLPFGDERAFKEFLKK